jgi:hypothetical protein
LRVVFVLWGVTYFGLPTFTHCHEYTTHPYPRASTL